MMHTSTNALSLSSLSRFLSVYSILFSHLLAPLETHSTSGSGGLSGGILAAIIVPSLVALGVLFLVLAFILYRRRRARGQASVSERGSEHVHASSIELSERVPLVRDLVLGAPLGSGACACTCYEIV